MTPASRVFDATSAQVEPIRTRYRNIVTPVPHPEDVRVLSLLHEYEPISMGGQPPIVWDHAEAASVYDAWGNRWIDFSSGVLVANCGHSHPRMQDALIDQISEGVIFNYCFPNNPRARLVKRLVDLAGGRIDRCFLLTTGAEATENAIKLCRTHGIETGGRQKRVFVTFEGAFHGRTMGSQMAGGIPRLKDWIGIEDTGFVQAPFPDERTGADADFSAFEQALKKLGVQAGTVCGVMAESYQGGTGRFYPQRYMQQLRQWCDDNGALLVLDEVQAGFGRTGRLFTFQHYEIDPDIICCGKGLSGGLPISAVLGNSRFMGAYGPGEMTSTHSGNALCARAALTSLDIIEDEGLVARSEALGQLLGEHLDALASSNPGKISAVNGRGLMKAVLFRDDEDGGGGASAMKVVEWCVRHGVMLYAPLGPGGATVKINPPLVIPEDALLEGLQVFSEAVEEAL